MYFLNTFTTLRKRICLVCAMNSGREAEYLSAGLPVGTVTTASADYSRFIAQASVNEIKIDLNCGTEG